MRHAARWSLVTLLLASLTSPGSAQTRVELGIDAGLSVLVNGNTVTVVSIPASTFRAGFRVAPQITLEPRVGFNHITGGGSSLTALDAGLHALFELASAPAGPEVYLTAGAALIYADTGVGSGTDQTIGAGVGVRLPTSVDRLAFRLEGRADRQLDASVTTISALVGISFFTR